MNNKDNSNKSYSRDDKKTSYTKSKENSFNSKSKDKTYSKPERNSFSSTNSESKFKNKDFSKKSSFKLEGSFIKSSEKFGDRDNSKTPYSKQYSNNKPYESRENSKPAYNKPYAGNKPFEAREGSKPYPDKKTFGSKEYSKPSYDRNQRNEERDGRGTSYGEKKSFSKSYTPKYENDSKASSANLNTQEWSNFKGKHVKDVINNRDENGFIKRPKKELKERKPSEKLGFDENRRVGPAKPPVFEESKLIAKLPPKVKAKVEKEDLADNSKDIIRLNKYISNAGLCSRREADELIASGQILVNGTVVTEMGYKVLKTDVVKYGRKILSREKFVYLLLNKPKDFITTTEDPEDRKTVMDLLKNACDERIYPIGRLDRMTTGLLLLTNDGELTEKLSHPSNNIKKVYQVELDKPLTNEDFDKIKTGIELEDGLIKADDLAFITPDAEVIGIEIHSGKNRIVRRIFESLGYEVKKLDRTTYAGLTKKDLPRGKWRFLTEKELIRLKYLI